MDPRKTDPELYCRARTLSFQIYLWYVTVQKVLSKSFAEVRVSFFVAEQALALDRSATASPRAEAM